MKAVIITIHRVHNYGTILQAYASQMILEQKGYKTRIIDYRLEKQSVGNQLKAFFKGKGIKGLIRGAARSGSYFVRMFQFYRFSKRNLQMTRKYTCYKDLENDPPLADLYVTGSDQTWNQDYNDGVDPGYFLRFVPEGKRRVSFATSFGRTQLDSYEMKITKEYLKAYQYISVREASALRILESLGRNDGVHILDPTLQLSAEYWSKVACKPVYKKPYVLLFLLYGDDQHASEYARMIADEKGLKLVKLSWEWRKGTGVDRLFSHRSPEVFLSLMEHADYVVTNSFHGLAFAINFERLFIVEARSKYNTRLESLLQRFGLLDRMILQTSSQGEEIDAKKKVLNLIKQPIDYHQLKSELEKEREKARKFVDMWSGGESDC